MKFHKLQVFLKIALTPGFLRSFVIAMVPCYDKLVQTCAILLKGLKTKILAKVVKFKISQITKFSEQSFRPNCNTFMEL